jgi:hypothetical protein
MLDKITAVLIFDDELAEIARLQNSLQHLRATQDMLRETLKTDDDPELASALEENDVVMFVLLLIIGMHYWLTCMLQRLSGGESRHLKACLARERYSSRRPL